MGICYLRDASTGRNNNLDLIRFVAAVAVLYSHAFPLVTGRSELEPLNTVSRGQFTLGHLAVAVFFVVSGFLMSQSYERSNNFVRFAWARFLRIIPGLLGVVLITTFILGPAVSSLTASDYFRHPEVYRYLRTLFVGVPFRSAPATLPGVFQLNPFGPPVNGSLWTLTPEVLCYGLVGVLGVAKLLRKRITLTVFAASLVLPFVSVHPTAPLFAYFAVGMVFYAYRAILPLAGFVAVGCGLVLCMTAYSGFALLSPLLIGYLVLYGAYGTRYKWPSFNKYGDFSYGVYIYGFPVQQTVVYLSGNSLTPFGNFLVSTPIALALAFLSWRFIENRALRYKNIIPVVNSSPGVPGHRPPQPSSHSTRRYTASVEGRSGR